MSVARYQPADELTTLHSSHTRWPGFDLLAASDDIRRPTEWRINQPRPTVIVHLGGRMDLLETEQDAHGGSRGPALPGECWLIPAGQRYVSRAQGGTIHYAVLTLDPAPPADCAEAIRHPFELSPGSALHDPFLHQSVLRLLAATREDSDLARMFGRSLGCSLWLHLHGKHGCSGPSRDHPKPPAYETVRARALRDFIHDRLDDALSIDDLTAITGQTTHQLLVTFRATFGQSPWQYIIAERLRQARRLLGGTAKDITTIALETGFSSHLTRVFRQRLGCSPSEFRAAHRHPWVPGWR